MSRSRLSTAWQIAVVLALAAVGCHREPPEDIPPADSRKITIADRFYDVVAFDEKTAIVCGYAGKILRTDDGGYTWTLIRSGTDRALYAMRFTDPQHGWIVGQEGLVLHTEDGGLTWARQPTPATVYLFSVDFVNTQEGWAVGDKATYIHTTDGGRSWKLGKLGTSDQHLSAEEQILAQEPVLYAVRFVDPKTGWIIGEFGNVYRTTDGGHTWHTQQESLIGQGIYDSLDIPTFFGAAFIDAQNGIAAGLETKVARTRDGGAKWAFDPVAVTDGTGDPLYQPFMFPDTTAWAVGAAAVVLHQPSTGEPWLRVPVGEDVNTWLRGVYFVDKNDGWIVGGFGTILHTTDGGQTWLRALG